VDRTGLGHTVWWAGSYEVTPPEEGCGWEPTGHYEDSTPGCVSRILGQAPTRISCCSGEVFECLPRDVAFQAAHDLSGVLPFVTAASHIRSGPFVTRHAGQHDSIQSSVGLTVTATVQPDSCTEIGLRRWSGQRYRASRVRH
jgi:hypothetical protein